jgi:hypothetical protein
MSDYRVEIRVTEEVGWLTPDKHALPDNEDQGRANSNSLLNTTRAPVPLARTISNRQA